MRVAVVENSVILDDGLLVFWDDSCSKESGDFSCQYNLGVVLPGTAFLDFKCLVCEGEEVGPQRDLLNSLSFCGDVSIGFPGRVQVVVGAKVNISSPDFSSTEDVVKQQFNSIFEHHP